MLGEEEAFYSEPRRKKSDIGAQRRSLFLSSAIRLD